MKFERLQALREDADLTQRELGEHTCGYADSSGSLLQHQCGLSGRADGPEGTLEIIFSPPDTGFLHPQDKKRGGCPLDSLPAFIPLPDTGLFHWPDPASSVPDILLSAFLHLPLDCS